MLYFHSIDQLKATYGEHAAGMLDNLGTQQYFGINSFETADHLSKRIGDATILVESINRSRSRSRPSNPMATDGGTVTTSEGNNIAEQGRRVIRTEVILVLPESVSLVFHKNLPPIATELVRHYNAPEFARNGTGRDRSIGLGAVAASLLVLAASLGFAGLMLALPSPATLRQGLSTPRLRREAMASPRTYSIPQLPLVSPTPARRPAARTEPEFDWDFEGRVWRVRPDGSKEVLACPQKPGRSGRK